MLLTDRPWPGRHWTTDCAERIALELRKLPRWYLWGGAVPDASAAPDASALCGFQEALARARQWVAMDVSSPCGLALDITDTGLAVIDVENCVRADLDDADLSFVAGAWQRCEEAWGQVCVRAAALGIVSGIDSYTEIVARAGAGLSALRVVVQHGGDGEDSVDGQRIGNVVIRTSGTIPLAGLSINPLPAYLQASQRFVRWLDVGAFKRDCAEAAKPHYVSY